MLAYITILLFILAAIFGLVLFTYVWRREKTPKVIVIAHGAFAVMGLLSLIVSAVIYATHLWLSVLIFVLAAGGGLYLFTRDVTGKKVPRVMFLMHGLLGICGIIILIASIFYFNKL